MKEHILVVKDEKVGKIIFNKPNKFNSLTIEMLKQIKIAVEELDNDPNIHVILITGNGKGFCAGADLTLIDDLTTMSAVQIRNILYRHFAGGVKALKLCSKPTIAMVRGPAVGAGCEIAIACDFRIVSETAMFREVWVKLGMTSPLGGLFLLPRLVGLSRATEMFMTAKPVNGKEAERIGLANKCVSDDKLDDEAMAFAKKLAQGAPLALSAIKEGLRRGMESTLYAEWEANSSAQAILLSSEDFRGAIKARKESRNPDFKGK